MRIHSRPIIGLTLVEFLVVLAIVAILSALVSTAVHTAIWRTKVSVCATNLTQIGKALEMYCNENDDRVPPYYLESGEDMRGNLYKAMPSHFIASFQKYAIEPTMFFCPLDDGAHKLLRHHRSEVDHRWTSYAYSPGVAHFMERELLPLTLTVSKISDPSSTVYLMDSGWFSGKKTFDLSAHGDSRNLLYFDGHVKQVSTHAPPCYFPGQSPSCP